MASNQHLKISVVTPSWNQAAFLPDALESVRDQGYPNVEHLVLDNCSTDGSVEILKKYSQLNLICEPDKGQSDALNKGFKMASGDIIGWLNADDRYLPECFETVAEFFKAHPKCDIVYGNYRLIDREGRVLSRRKELSFDLFMLKYLHVLYIPSTTVFFRRRIFEEGNFLDADYHYAMDYEYFLRLALKGYRFCHIDAFLADFRTYPESKSQRQTLTQKQEMEKALLQQDSFLKRLSEPWRQGVRNTFMMAARGKRCSLKFLRGAYFQ
mgnify:CR=1 FL=1